MTSTTGVVAAGGIPFRGPPPGLLSVPLAALHRPGQSGKVPQVNRSCVIVDDSEAFRASAAALLESQGMTVLGCACSGDEAAQMADALEPQVALIDVALGDEDGIVLARQFADRRPGIAVVLVSAYEQSDASELIAGSGAVGFLSKRALSARAIEALLN